MHYYVFESSQTCPKVSNTIHMHNKSLESDKNDVSRNKAPSFACNPCMKTSPTRATFFQHVPPHPSQPFPLYKPHFTPKPIQYHTHTHTISFIIFISKWLSTNSKPMAPTTRSQKTGPTKLSRQPLRSLLVGPS